MTARLRSLVAVAILLALVAHPLAHPLLKECPCLHEVATAAGEPAPSFVLPLVAAPLHLMAAAVDPAPPISVRASRAPPAA